MRIKGKTIAVANANKGDNLKSILSKCNTKEQYFIYFVLTN